MKYAAAYYMVHDEVWELGGGGRGLLCLGCLAKRLGRKLRRQDFTAAPANRRIFDILNNVEP